MSVVNDFVILALLVAETFVIYVSFKAGRRWERFVKDH